MILDRTIDRAITKALVEHNENKNSKHISSGKLSAGSLGKPLQWQMLHTLGVPTKELDPYVLRLFKRGVDVEGYVEQHIPNLIEKQKFCQYKGAIGYIDTMIDASKYESGVGIIPTEVKSVKNSKYTRILAMKQPDRSHILQACMYALSQKTSHFGILYIASDDYRMTHWILDTDEYKKEVDTIIDNYNKQMKLKTLPAFSPPEKWMSNLQYSDYPQFMELTEAQCNEKLEREYPEAWKKLIQ